MPKKKKFESPWIKWNLHCVLSFKECSTNIGENVKKIKIGRFGHLSDVSDISWMFRESGVSVFGRFGTFSDVTDSDVLTCIPPLSLG